MLTKSRFEGDTELIANPGEPMFTVTRTFNAPARFVWEAWTTPEYMKRWYGNSCSTLEVCETDVRVEQLHQSVQSWDAHIASGMEPGMRETLDRLEAFLSALAN